MAPSQGENLVFDDAIKELDLMDLLNILFGK